MEQTFKPFRQTGGYVTFDPNTSMGFLQWVNWNQCLRPVSARFGFNTVMNEGAD
jgi:hypothetical protein